MTTTTTTTPKWKQALEAFVEQLRRSYGARLDGVILYGSRARNDAADQSDIDTLVVLSPCGGFWAEFARISPLADDVSLEHDVVISAIPVDRAEFESGQRPLLMNVRREGVRVG